MLLVLSLRGCWASFSYSLEAVVRPMNGDSTAQTCWRDDIREQFRHASLATSASRSGHPSLRARAGSIQIRSWLHPAVRGRQGVRPLSWSKPTFEPLMSLLIVLLPLQPGCQTSAGGERDGKV
jgi:hypothetical protein